MQTYAEIRRTLPGQVVEHVVLSDTTKPGLRLTSRVEFIGFLDEILTREYYVVYYHDGMSSNPTHRGFETFMEALTFYLAQ